MGEGWGRGIVFVQTVKLLFFIDDNWADACCQSCMGGELRRSGSYNRKRPINGGWRAVIQQMMPPDVMPPSHGQNVNPLILREIVDEDVIWSAIKHVQVW